MPLLPPTLTDHKTDLDWLSDIGGPADVPGLSFLIDVSLSMPCERYAEREILSVVMPYSPSLEAARRHWPRIAQSLHLYSIRQKYHSPANDAKPSEIEELLKAIRSDADRLSRELSRLETVTGAWRDNSHILKDGHLAYVLAILSQAVSSDPSPQLGELPDRWKASSFFREWRYSLFKLVEGAKIAQESYQPDLLKSVPRVTVPGLRDFVSRQAAIWTSLTGRVASVERVVSATKEDDAPDFITFVQKIARLNEAVEVPTCSQVQTAAKPRTKRRK
jgi:hypothetical protein